jgi:hypothetical protein
VTVRAWYAAQGVAGGRGERVTDDGLRSGKSTFDVRMELR